MGISTLVWSQTWVGQWQAHRPLFWLDLGAGLLAFVLVQLRRRRPLEVALLLTALAAVSAVAAGPATLAAVSLATRRRMLPILAVGVATALSSQCYTLTQPIAQPDPFWVNLGNDLVFTVGMLGWGMFIGSRRALLWTLRDRADRAEAEQQLRVDNARALERSRIAREMHDVLAHRITQVSLHAGALTYRDDLTAEQVRHTAELIQTNAHEALTDLRSVLGVLRSPDTGELVDRPQPTYDDLPDLISSSRDGGMNVEFTDLIDASEPVPVAVGRTLYRIVQEGLTNARKHAPGALLRIQLSGSRSDGIDLVLRNPVGFVTESTTPGSGLGLVGLSERAELRGGRLEHRKDGSMFVLHGWIPWAA